jgi:hypothetical protein
MAYLLSWLSTCLYAWNHRRTGGWIFTKYTAEFYELSCHFNYNSQGPICISACIWRVRVKLSLCLTKQALHHEGVWGSGCIDPHFLDLGTSWKWVISFIPWLLYPGKESTVPFVQVVGWTPLLVWTTWRSENSWSYCDLNSDLLVIQSIASRYTDCTIVALRVTC